MKKGQTKETHTLHLPVNNRVRVPSLVHQTMIPGAPTIHWDWEFLALHVSLLYYYKYY